MALIAFRKLWLERKTLSDSSAFILNITLLLLLTIVAMYRQPLAQYRYFMMLFAFMPFIYPFAFDSIRNRDMLLKVIASSDDFVVLLSVRKPNRLGLCFSSGYYY